MGQVDRRLENYGMRKSMTRETNVNTAASERGENRAKMRLSKMAG